MIKEFAVILGYPLDSTVMIALPDMDMQISHKLISYIDMSPDDIYSSLLPSGLMNLSFLITACETKDKIILLGSELSLSTYILSSY